MVNIDALQKSEGGSVRSDFKILDSFTLETSKNHLIRNFLRNKGLKVNIVKFVFLYIEFPENFFLPISSVLKVNS